VYLPDHFRQADLVAVQDFIREVAAAELVTWNGSVLEASTVPLLFELDDRGVGRLIGHLARENPQWRSLSPERDTLVIFRGPDDYISPGWYPTKKEHGRVVPTWNYASVHLTGRPTIHDDDAWKLDLVTRLTRQHEASCDAPWAVSDAPEEFIARQLQAIVGVEIVASRLEAKWKLSQNQPLRNREGVVAGLTEKDTPRSRRLAEFMRSS
jgi:transcriptional regulator